MSTKRKSTNAAEAAGLNADLLALTDRTHDGSDGLQPLPSRP